MAVFDSLKKLFQKRRSINEITMDELRRERIRLEQEEARVAREVENLEEQKRQLFLKGKDEASQRQRAILARKIKELDVQARNQDKQLQFLSRQLRIVNGLTQLKESKRLLEHSGLSELITRLDLPTLQTYIEEASIDGAFHMDKFQEILRTIEDTSRIVGEVEEDRDILEIMKAMEEAKLAEMESPGLAEQIAERRLSEILAREEPETEL